MPLQRLPDSEGTVVHTRLYGRVTDGELLAYYERLLAEGFPMPLRELVDGTEVEDMALTGEGEERLAMRIARDHDLVRGGRVAMVAITPATYGMFRMWELKRAALDYEVEVFRDRAVAEAWLRAGTGEDGARDDPAPTEER